MEAKLANIHQHGYKIDDGLNIVLVGFGGTGLPLAHNILKTLGGLDKKIQQRFRFIGIEGDKFEPKNLGRQLCIPTDMGKNKAAVAIGRYAGVYSVPDSCAMYVDSFLETKDQLHNCMMSSFTNVIIDCVDKNKPRALIQEAVKEFVDKRAFAYTYLISCGNGEWSGQVSLGAYLKSNKQYHKPVPGKTIVDAPYTFCIPSPYVVHPELVDPKRDEEEEALSCGDRAVLNVQTMAANNFAATLAFNYVNSMISNFVHMVEDKPLLPQTNGTVRFNAKTNGVTCEQLTDEYLAKEVF